VVLLVLAGSGQPERVLSQTGTQPVVEPLSADVPGITHETADSSPQVVASDQEDAKTAAVNSTIFGTYRGTMTVRALLTNVYGQQLGVATYQVAADVVIDRPISTVRGFRETNPFNLIISPRQLVNNYGEVSVFSAFPHDHFGFYQYWSYALQGNRFSGSLRNSFASHGLAVNMITLPREIAPHIWMPYSIALVEGSLITGSFGNNQVQIHIDSNTTDWANPFELDIVAARQTNNIISQPISRPFSGEPVPAPRINQVYLPLIQQ
jgi:hypothetical protein